MVNSHNNIMLIGPLGTGKSTISKHLSQNTGLKNFPIDKLKWFYRFKNGYDLIESSNRLLYGGFEALIEYASNFFGPKELSEILCSFNGIIDLGATDTHSTDANRLQEIEMLFENHNNIFLILPYECNEHSHQILSERLRKRYKYDELKKTVIDSYIKKNKEFLESPTNRSLAKHIIYTNDRSYDAIVEEIIYKSNLDNNQNYERNRINLQRVS